MNQAILQPKEEDRYLAVVVPKEAWDFEIFNSYCKQVRFFLPGINPLTDSQKYGDINLIRIKDQDLPFMSTLQSVEIIGLLSNITEEQAKEMGFVSLIDNIITCLDGLKMCIEDSGLTYTSEQDVLLIKIN